MPIKSQVCTVQYSTGSDILEMKEAAHRSLIASALGEASAVLQQSCRMQLSPKQRSSFGEDSAHDKTAVRRFLHFKYFSAINSTTVCKYQYGSQILL